MGRARQPGESVLVVMAGVSILLCAAAERVDGAIVTLIPNAALSEEYNDNIFFTPQKTDDFVTRLHIGMGITYQTEKSFTTTRLGASAVYFARSANATVNLAEAQRLNVSTTYDWSENLTFSISEALGRVNDTRDIGYVNYGGTFLPPPQQETDPAGNNPSNVNLILPRGSALVNSFAINANYRFDPRWSSVLSYQNGVSNFIDPSSTNLSQRWGVQLGYQWSPSLSIGPALSYALFNTNNAPDTEAYTVTVGSNYQINELWNAFGSLGTSVRRNLEGPGDARANLNFTAGINRTFEYSQLTIGAQQGITPSAGIAGASNTLSAYLNYSIQLTQNLGGLVTAHYSHFDTTVTSFDVYQIRGGLFYPIWQNLSASLFYLYRRSDSNQGVGALNAGVVDANLVHLQIGWAEPWLQFDP